MIHTSSVGIIRLRRSLLPLSLAAIAGCAESSANATAVESDSAGHRILTFQHEPNTLPAVHLGQPELRIGTDADGEGVQLHRVRGALRLADGRIAIADESSGSIRIFSSAGSLVNQFGSLGGGAGEVTRISVFAREAGDTLWIYDPARMSATRWSAEGHLVSSVRVPAATSGPFQYVFPLLEDRRIGLRHESSVIDGVTRTTGMHRERYVALLVDSAEADTIAVFPGQDRFYLPQEGLSRGRYALPFLGFQPIWAVAGDCVYALMSDALEISSFCRSKQQQTIWRWPAWTKPISVEEFWEELAAETKRVTGNEASTRHLKRDYPYPVPTTRPPAGALVVDAAERLWLAPHTGHELPGEWFVLGDDGKVVRVLFESPSRLLEVGFDHILALSRDSLDVERVDFYELPDQLRSEKVR